MDEKMRGRITVLIDRYRTMSLATLRPDGWPQATTVGYGNEALAVCFLCGLDSQKARNLARGARVSVPSTVTPTR